MGEQKDANKGLFRKTNNFGNKIAACNGEGSSTKNSRVLKWQKANDKKVKVLDYVYDSKNVYKASSLRCIM